MWKAYPMDIHCKSQQFRPVDRLNLLPEPHWYSDLAYPNVSIPLSKMHVFPFMCQYSNKIHLADGLDEERRRV